LFGVNIITSPRPGIQRADPGNRGHLLEMADRPNVELDDLAAG
jgi:hypothetical protein